MRYWRWLVAVLSVVFVFPWQMVSAYAATLSINSGYTFGNIQNASNAIDGNFGTYAALNGGGVGYAYLGVNGFAGQQGVVVYYTGHQPSVLAYDSGNHSLSGVSVTSVTSDHPGLNEIRATEPPNTSFYEFQYSGASGTYSDIYEVQPAVVPPSSAPSVSVASVTASSAVLNWSSVNGATSYSVYTSSGTLVQSGITGQSYTLTGLAQSTSYAYYVVAVNSGGSGPASNTVSFSTLGPPTSAPGSVQATPQGDTAVSVSWSAVSGASGYHVYVDGVQKADVSGTSATVSGLMVGTQYSVSVAAYNQYGEGPKSGTVNVTTMTPQVPTGLSAGVGDGWVQVGWNLVPGAKQYRVYRDGSLLATVTTNVYRDSSVTNGTTYQYQVSEVDADGNESALSGPVSARPQPPPVPVNGFAAYGGGTSLRFTWGGTMAPFTLTIKQGGNVIGTYTVNGNTYTVTGLIKNTDYTATIVDKGNNTASVAVNTGSIMQIFPPAPPDATPSVQSMVNGFGSAGWYVMYVVLAAVGLGVILVVAIFVWRRWRQWTVAARSRRMGNPSVGGGRFRFRVKSKGL